MNKAFTDVIQMNETTQMKLFIKEDPEFSKVLLCAQIEDGKMIHGFALDKEQTQQLKNFIFGALRTSFDHNTNKIFEDDLDELILKKSIAVDSREVMPWEEYDACRKKFLNRWSPR